LNRNGKFSFASGWITTSELKTDKKLLLSKIFRSLLRVASKYLY